MGVFQVKKYKVIKDENGNKVQEPKTKEEWNKETKNGTATWYFVDRYDLNGKRKQYKSALFALKREAEEHERLFLINPIDYILNHSKRAKNSLEIKLEEKDKNEKTLNDYFPLFIEYKTEYIKGSSIYNDKINWNLHLKDDFGELHPEELSLKTVQDWHANANKKINSKTNNLYNFKTKNTWHTTLSEFMQYLYKHGLIEINYSKVAGGFKNPNINRNEKPKIKYQTEEQYNLFMSVVDDDIWYAFFNFLFWHGSRKGEQRALKIHDIILNHDSITLNKTFARTKNGGETVGPIKNGKIRTIYLAKQSKIYIEKLIKFYQEMDGYSDDWFLFGGAQNIYKNRIDDKLKFYYDKLEKKYPNMKINRLTHHEFGRHSHASYLLEEGIKKGLPSEEVYAIIAQRLGDTLDVIKSTYAHQYEDANNDKAKNILN